LSQEIEPMTTARVTYADVHAVIDHPIDRVWEEIARFDGLERWVSGVVGCDVEGERVGAVRTVSLGDRSARERLEELDDASHRLRYHILPPHAMPADDVHSEIILTAIGNDRTEIVWRSEAAGFVIPPEQLGARIGAFYGKSIEGLCRLLDGA
jgi:hypothetical protein